MGESISGLKKQKKSKRNWVINLPSKLASLWSESLTVFFSSMTAAERKKKQNRKPGGISLNKLENKIWLPPLSAGLAVG